VTSSHARLNAGRYLIEAKTMLAKDEPGASFEAWCAANVKRGMRDIYKCMFIAGFDEPERALWKEQAERAEGMAARRVPQTGNAVPRLNVGQQDRSVKMAIGLYRKMTPDQRRED
jgi:hypothetical protein